MTFNEYQEACKKFDRYPLGMQIMCHTLGLNDESGEVAGKVKKVYRDNYGDFGPSIELLKKEIGDVLWYLARLCDDFGLTLQEVAQCNIDKLTDRMNRDVLQGSGDNR